MSPDGSGVEQQPVQVRFLQLFEDTLPNAFPGPAPEALVDRVPGAVALWEVTPRSAAAGNPEHGVDELAVVFGCAPHIGGLARKQGRQALPVIVADLVTSHKLLKLKQT